MAFFKSIFPGLLLAWSVARLTGAGGLVPASPLPRQESLAAVLPAAKWQEVARSVDRGLAWTAAHRRRINCCRSISTEAAL
jgi:hypothetical protein